MSYTIGEGLVLGVRFVHPGDALRARATPERSRNLRSVSVRWMSVAIAALALWGCNRGQVAHSEKPTQGGYIHVFDATNATVEKFCDEGRIVYFAIANGRPSIAVVENAKECDGNAYVAEPRK